MLANPIEILILNVGANAITDFFIAIIVFCFLFAIYSKRSGKRLGFAHYAPTLLTSLGILGTFCGIVAGLLGFDASDIDGSIDGLLEGMKTAFTTSLVGMSSSIIYKIMMSAGLLEGDNKEEVEDGQVGVTELLASMKQQVRGIDALQQAIGGDGDSSLTSQLKLFRGDTNDNFKLSEKNEKTYNEELLNALGSQQIAFTNFQDKLWLQLQTFSELLSKSATETVIEALKQVITDFNQNLTEQFGENFQQLNEACKELVLWQDQYKTQLGDMTTKYALGVESIEITASAVDKISEHTASIPDHMTQLTEVTQVNQRQIEELESHLSAFKDIRDKAVEALPEIRDRIDATLDGVQAAATELAVGIAASSDTIGQAIISGAQEFIDNTGKVNGSIQTTADAMSAHNEVAMTHYTDLQDGMNANYRDLSERMQDEAKKISEQYSDAGKQLTQNIGESKDAFNSGLEAMRNQLNTTLEGMVARQGDEANKIFSGLSNQVEGAVSKTGAAVEGQIKMLEEAQERELKKVMSEMGSALATITNRFTDDYAKLVAEMQTIVGRR